MTLTPDLLWRHAMANLASINTDAMSDDDVAALADAMQALAFMAATDVTRWTIDPDVAARMEALSKRLTAAGR
jgi:hypothetical protein